MKVHRHARKIRRGRRRKGILWDFNGDGVFSKERMCRFYKRYWRKWLSRKLKNDKSDYS